MIFSVLIDCKHSHTLLRITVPKLTITNMATIQKCSVISHKLNVDILSKIFLHIKLKLWLCMSMYVFMYVCGMYVCCKHVCMYVCAYVHMYVHVYVCSLLDRERIHRFALNLARLFFETKKRTLKCQNSRKVS
jgi:hypothetical protein